MTDGDRQWHGAAARHAGRSCVAAARSNAAAPSGAMSIASAAIGGEASPD